MKNTSKIACFQGEINQAIFLLALNIKRKFIIYPECFDANNIISDPIIQNLKRKLNMVHDL